MAKSAELTFFKNYKSTIFLAIAGSILLMVVNSAVWVNNQIFNSTNFANTVTTSLTSESSRNAIAQSVTDDIFSERPIAKRVAGNFSTKIISGLLATDQFERVLYVSAEKLQIYTTSAQQQDITIDFTSVKSVVSKLVSVADQFGQDVKIDSKESSVPDQITIVKQSDVPNFYTIGVVFLWLAPIAFIASVALLAYPYIKKKLNYKKILVVQSLTLILFASLTLLTGPMFKPPLMSQIDMPNNRIVVGNLYDAFIRSFDYQVYNVILFGVMVLLFSVILIYYPILKKTLNSTRKKTK